MVMVMEIMNMEVILMHFQVILMNGKTKIVTELEIMLIFMND